MRGDFVTRRYDFFRVGGVSRQVLRNPIKSSLKRTKKRENVRALRNRQGGAKTFFYKTLHTVYIALPPPNSPLLEIDEDF